MPLPCRSPTTTTRKCPMEAGTPRHGERPCPDARSNRDEPRTEHHLDFHHLTRCHPPRRRAEARNKTEQRETARLIRRPFHPTFQLPWAWPCSCSGSAKRCESWSMSRGTIGLLFAPIYLDFVGGLCVSHFTSVHTRFRSMA